MTFVFHLGHNLAEKIQNVAGQGFLLHKELIPVKKHCYNASPVPRLERKTVISEVSYDIREGKLL